MWIVSFAEAGAPCSISPSITVNANWRIIFRLESGKAFDVDLVDYH
jgi:plasmid maintenance system killer protein